MFSLLKNLLKKMGLQNKITIKLNPKEAEDLRSLIYIGYLTMKVSIETHREDPLVSVESKERYLKALTTAYYLAEIELHPYIYGTSTKKIQELLDLPKKKGTCNEPRTNRST